MQESEWDVVFLFQMLELESPTFSVCPLCMNYCKRTAASVCMLV